MNTTSGADAVDLVAVRRGALASAIPFLFISAKLFSVWFDPLIWDGMVWVKYAVGLAMMEFIIAHSGFFFAGRALDARSNEKRIYEYIAIILLYSVIAIAFSFFAGIQLLMVFIFVMAGRFITIVSANTIEERKIFKIRGLTSAVLYFSLLIFTAAVYIPRFGISPAIVKPINWGHAHGLWISQPQRPIAMLAIYFLLLGLMEVYFFFSFRESQPKWARIE